MREGLAAFLVAGHAEGVVFIGRAQEKVRVFATTRRRDPDGALLSVDHPGVPGGRPPNRSGDSGDSFCWAIRLRRGRCCDCSTRPRGRRPGVAVLAAQAQHPLGRAERNSAFTDSSSPTSVSQAGSTSLAWEAHQAGCA
jgi:hypothetical protein